MSSDNAAIPKAVYYHFPMSVWAAAPRLALEEKGYGADEIELKVVDLVVGQNYAPAYLRINPNGTVPTLVVPVSKTISPDVETRFRAITDTKSIIEFLDKSRSAISRTHTTSSAPAPTLAPATVEGSKKVNLVIELLHSPTADPNRLAYSARNKSELLAKSNGFQGVILRNRLAAIQEFIAAEADAPSDRVRKFLQVKLEATQKELQPFELVLKEESELTPEESKIVDDFCTTSEKAWSVELVQALQTLESELEGPYTLGDQLSLADVHLAAWLTRIVALAAGPNDKSPNAILQLQLTIGESFKIGPKVVEFWTAIIQRPAWKKVYSEGMF